MHVAKINVWPIGIFFGPMPINRYNLEVGGTVIPRLVRSVWQLNDRIRWNSHSEKLKKAFFCNSFWLHYASLSCTFLHLLYMYVNRDPERSGNWISIKTQLNRVSSIGISFNLASNLYLNVSLRELLCWDIYSTQMRRSTNIYILLCVHLGKTLKNVPVM